MSFRNIRGTEFPSPAAQSTRDWTTYTDKVQIPALVLMENMAVDGSHAAFLTSKNLDRLMSSAATSSAAVTMSHTAADQRLATPRKTMKVVNSQVVHITLGQAESYSTVEEPIKIMFRHISTFSNLTRPECVSWDTGISAWSGARCATAFSNATHTWCECNTVGTLALLETLDTAGGVSGGADTRHEVTLVFIVIVSITVTIIIAISAVLLSVYCSRVKVRLFFIFHKM